MAGRLRFASPAAGSIPACQQRRQLLQLQQRARGAWQFRLLPALALLLLADTLAAATAAPPADIATAVYLTDYPAAKCLDGSPGYFYIRTASAEANASKWVVHLQ